MIRYWVCVFLLSISSFLQANYVDIPVKHAVLTASAWDPYIASISIPFYSYYLPPGIERFIIIGEETLFLESRSVIRFSTPKLSFKHDDTAETLSAFVLPYNLEERKERGVLMPLDSSMFETVYIQDITPRLRQFLPSLTSLVAPKGRMVSISPSSFSSYFSLVFPLDFSRGWPVAGPYTISLPVWVFEGPRDSATLLEVRTFSVFLDVPLKRGDGDVNRIYEGPVKEGVSR